MKLSIEKIIEIVTREVIRELQKNGIEVDLGNDFQEVKSKSWTLETAGFKTPILTANNLEMLDKEVNEVIVPERTVITPGARDIIKKKAYKIIHKS